MDRLNKEYFETKEKYKKGIRKLSNSEKSIYLFISVSIAILFIIYKKNIN